MPDIDDLFFCDYLEADATYNNDATLNDTALSVVVESSEKYKIELVASGTSVARSLNFDFGGTATITHFKGVWESFDPANFLGVHNSASVTSAATDYSDGAGDGVDFEYRFVGSVEINVGGTFLLRAAQHTADASNTVLKRGSTLVRTKMS